MSQCLALVKTLNYSEVESDLRTWRQPTARRSAFRLSHLARSQPSIPRSTTAFCSSKPRKPNSKRQSNRKTRTAESSPLKPARLTAMFRGRTQVTDKVKLELGLSVRPAKPSPVVPITPEKFQAYGDSAGVNFISWKAAGNQSGTQYEIWYKEGTKEDWRLALALYIYQMQL